MLNISAFVLRPTWLHRQEIEHQIMEPLDIEHRPVPHVDRPTEQLIALPLPGANSKSRAFNPMSAVKSKKNCHDRMCAVYTDTV